MDLHLHDAAPTEAEREAIDAALGPPASGWDGGERDPVRDTHVGVGGAWSRSRRHMLLPALHAAPARVGWISEGALNYICRRLSVPPADAWGVATFYALFSTTPRPTRVLHVCDDIACRCRGATELIARLETAVGPAHHPPRGDHTEVGECAWVRSPCLGMCDQAPVALFQGFGAEPVDVLMPKVTPAIAMDALRRPDAVMGLGSSTPPTGASTQRAASADRLLTRRIGVIDPFSLTPTVAPTGTRRWRRRCAWGRKRSSPR